MKSCPSWTEQVLGVRFRSIGYAAVVLVFAGAAVTVIATLHLRSRAALQAAVAARSKRASVMHSLCARETIFEANSPTGLLANHEWVAARLTSFPRHCVLPADRVELDQLLQKLAVTQEPTQWQHVIDRRNELLRAYTSSLFAMVTL